MNTPEEEKIAVASAGGRLLFMFVAALIDYSRANDAGVADTCADRATLAAEGLGRLIADLDD